MKEIGEIFRARTGDIMDLHEGDQEPVKDLVNSRRLLKVPETAELADARTILGLSSKEDCLLQLWPYACDSAIVELHDWLNLGLAETGFTQKIRVIGSIQ